MLKILSIKITKTGTSSGPFSIYDQFGNLIAEGVPLQSLIEGVSYPVDENVNVVRMVSTGDCASEKYAGVSVITDKFAFFNTPVEETNTACLWRHLQNPEIYHSFYGVIEPYTIEYPISSMNTEIFQSFSDYSKVFKYTRDAHGVSNEPSKIELDDAYFNKAILYNGQQCSGVLNLVAKPKNNLKAYNLYPIYRNDGKDILYVKSDNVYKFNGFYDVVKDKQQFLFVRTCAPLSIDKTIHQENMIYTNRSFNKALLRAKDAKIRLTLDNRSDVHIVSQFVLGSTMQSYK